MIEPEDHMCGAIYASVLLAWNICSLKIHYNAILAYMSKLYYESTEF